MIPGRLKKFVVIDPLPAKKDKYTVNINLKDDYHVDRQKLIIHKIINLYDGIEFFNNKSILELGSYNGVIGNFFRECGANVTSVEGRLQNLYHIEKNYPDLKIIHANLDTPKWQFGKYDIILNLGLFDHLEKYNVEHLKNCIDNCEILILETGIINNSVKTYEYVLEHGKDKSLSDKSKILNKVCIDNTIRNKKSFFIEHNISLPKSDDFIENRIFYTIVNEPINIPIKFNDITLIIQGKYDTSFLHRINEYKKIFGHIILSVWKEKYYKDLPNDVELIELSPKIINSKTKSDQIYNYQNLYKQCVTTLNGLNNVKTKYVVKIRTDEFYSNMDKFCESIIINENKINTSNLFFRRDNYYRFHPSDKIIGAKTDILLKAFSDLKYRLELNNFKIGNYDFYKQPAESAIFTSILNSMGIDVDIDKSKELTKQHTTCLPVNKLYPFSCKFNGKKTVYNFPISYEQTEIVSGVNDV